MIFAARHRSYSRLDSSPVASGWSRSCSMMKRSIVTTDVDVCTLAIGRKCDSSRLVRSEDLAAPMPQPVEHFGCRMAVMIVRPHADHGLARPQLAEPRIRRGGGRAVMPHLEQLHAADPPGEVTFHRQPGVGLKQQARGAERHPQHYAVFVHVERQRHPDAVRTQHLEHDAVHLDPVAGPRRVPARSRPLYRREELEVQRPAERLAGLQYELGRERFDDGWQPAKVIGVPVGCHDHCQSLRAVASQERDHHPPPCVAAGNPRPPVDHDPTAVRSTQHGCVPLTHVTANVNTSPGTTIAPSGIAIRFASTPIGATVPNANAVIGAVRRVAAAAGASARTAQWPRAVARPAQITAAIALTDSQAPIEYSARGSTSSTASAESAITPRGAATRWRSRSTSSTTSIAVARSAGAGNPSSQR